MKSSFFKFTAFGALCLAVFAGKASALSLNSSGVVGIYDGKLANADVGTEIVAAQHLLDMLAGTHDGAYDSGDGLYLYQTSSTEYSGTLSGGTQTNLSASGWDWGFAKYDGQNAGYVLFYLGGADASSIIPQYPAGLWTDKPSQYAISHLTVFNTSSRQVPDAGATAVLLGLGLAGVAAIARRRKQA